MKTRTKKKTGSFTTLSNDSAGLRGKEEEWRKKKKSSAEKAPQEKEDPRPLSREEKKGRGVSENDLQRRNP